MVSKVCFKSSVTLDIAFLPPGFVAPHSFSPYRNSLSVFKKM